MTSPDASQHPDYLDDPEKHLPPHHNPLPELTEVGPHKKAISEDAFLRVQASPEFADLKKTFRGFAFPMTAAFLIWYFAYVLMSVYARGFMSQSIGLGNLNLGHALGLLQFLTTFLITWLYIRHANNNLDPRADKIRKELEGASK